MPKWTKYVWKGYSALLFLSCFIYLTFHFECQPISEHIFRQPFSNFQRCKFLHNILCYVLIRFRHTCAFCCVMRLPGFLDQDAEHSAREKELQRQSSRLCRGLRHIRCKSIPAYSNLIGLSVQQCFRILSRSASWISRPLPHILPIYISAWIGR